MYCAIHWPSCDHVFAYEFDSTDSISMTRVGLNQKPISIILSYIPNFNSLIDRGRCNKTVKWRLFNTIYAWRMSSKCVDFDWQALIVNYNITTAITNCNLKKKRCKRKGKRRQMRLRISLLLEPVYIIPDVLNIEAGLVIVVVGSCCWYSFKFVHILQTWSLKTSTGAM